MNWVGSTRSQQKVARAPRQKAVQNQREFFAKQLLRANGLPPSGISPGASLSRTRPYFVSTLNHLDQAKNERSDEEPQSSANRPRKDGTTSFTAPRSRKRKLLAIDDWVGLKRRGLEPLELKKPPPDPSFGRRRNSKSKNSDARPDWHRMLPLDPAKKRHASTPSRDQRPPMIIHVGDQLRTFQNGDEGWVSQSDPHTTRRPQDSDYSPPEERPCSRGEVSASHKLNQGEHVSPSALLSPLEVRAAMPPCTALLANASTISTSSLSSSTRSLSRTAFSHIRSVQHPNEAAASTNSSEAHTRSSPKSPHETVSEQRIEEIHVLATGEQESQSYLQATVDASIETSLHRADHHGGKGKSAAPASRPIDRTIDEEQLWRLFMFGMQQSLDQNQSRGEDRDLSDPASCLLKRPAVEQYRTPAVPASSPSDILFRSRASRRKRGQSGIIQSIRTGHHAPDVPLLQIQSIAPSNRLSPVSPSRWSTRVDHL